MSALQQTAQTQSMKKFRYQIEIGTFWSASVKVRRGTVSKEVAELQIRSVLAHMNPSPWLRQRLEDLLELNEKRV